MGVRGLTTFIAKNSEKYMENYHLHNTYLVIDGNNLAVQLYRWHARCIDCYGGEYDQYAEAVRSFFQNLDSCSIKPLILFDGCYENKKLKTIYDRVRQRVISTKKLNSATEGSVAVFPLFLRELFTEVVISMGLKTFRSEFEADYEMACLAKTINAPLLSYDSDFYIFDVLYIPFTGLDSTPRYKKDSRGKTIHYLECKLYKVSNFLEAIGGMDKDVLPLLATVAGNDYIAAGVFRAFYSQLKMVKRKRVDSDQQRKIESLIKWLTNETYETAAKKILGRIKRDHRQKLADRMEQVSKGYHCVKSNLLPYFGIDESEVKEISTAHQRRDSQIDLSSIPDVEGDGADEAHFSDEECAPVEEAPGELNLVKLKGHYPEWFVHQFQTCNFPAWFMDIAVRNRYFFIPQIENHEMPHSHIKSLNLLGALHKILRSNVTNEVEKKLSKKELTYISRLDHNFTKNSLLPMCTLQLPTLNEIPGMAPTELKRHLHSVLDMDDVETIEFLGKFDNSWKLYVLGILFWAQQYPEVNKLHIYSIALCGITLGNVTKKIGFVRRLKEVNRKFKNDAEFEPYVNFINEIIRYFHMDDRARHQPKRFFDIHVVDRFSRFQSALFHIKYLNKLLLMPYEDFLISDFYNGTFVYNIFTMLRKRSDPLSFLKSMCSSSMLIFGQFLQIAIEITCKLENIADGHNKKPKKRKNRPTSRDSVEEECKNEQIENAHLADDIEGAGRSFDPNNPYSILPLESN